MRVRHAEADDGERIRSIAHDSFRSSYSLSPQLIDAIVAEEFEDAALSEGRDDPDRVMLVADGEVEGREEVQGFATVGVGDGARLRWLHVHPEARGGGIATALIERVREDAGGTPLTASVLDGAAEGGDFLEGFGLEEDGHDELTVGGEDVGVTLFSEGQSSDDPNEPSVPVPGSVTVDGVERPVDGDDRVPGREAPFFVVYTDRDAADAYGYFCSECGSTNVSAGGLDRLECGECGNVHLAEEWDDAYL